MPNVGQGRTTIIGRKERADTLDATFLNSAGANIDDFCDTHLPTVIHPTSPVLPAVLAACAEAGIPAGPINPIDRVFADPQVEARGMRIELEGVPGVRSPFTFSDAELALDRPSPRKGQDG